jgi:hypothetical protein
MPAPSMERRFISYLQECKTIAGGVHSHRHLGTRALASAD